MVHNCEVIALKFIFGRLVMTESSRVQVKVLFFAKARELSGTAECIILIEPVITYSNVLNHIVEKFSLELIKNNLILAVNHEYAAVDQTLELKAGDEIAVIPPLSGGKAKYFSMDIIKLLSTKISIEEVTDSVASPSCGATSVFIGTTRDNFDNKKVMQLEYEAYEPMAETAMKKICTDIREKWKVQNIAIYHRLGVVPVIEASVVIAISSPHRAESLEAVQFAINSLKSLVPIWKKEIYDGDAAQWKSNKECAWK